MNAQNSSKGSRKATYHHGNLRQALVDAGLQQLEENARGEPSLRELARQVGVTVNAAYRHFTDKEAVLAAMAAEGFRRFSQAQSEAAEGAEDPQEALLALGRAYIRFARDNPALFRLMFGRFEQTHVDPELEAAGDAAFGQLREAVARLIGLPQEDDRVTAATVNAWGLVHGLSHLLLDGRLAALASDPEALAEQALFAIAPASTEGRDQANK